MRYNAFTSDVPGRAVPLVDYGARMETHAVWTEHGHASLFLLLYHRYPLASSLSNKSRDIFTWQEAELRPRMGAVLTLDLLHRSLNAVCTLLFSAFFRSRSAPILLAWPFAPPSRAERVFHWPWLWAHPIPEFAALRARVSGSIGLESRQKGSTGARGRVDAGHTRTTQSVAFDSECSAITMHIFAAVCGEKRKERFRELLQHDVRWASGRPLLLVSCMEILPIPRGQTGCDRAKVDCWEG